MPGDQLCSQSFKFTKGNEILFLTNVRNLKFETTATQVNRVIHKNFHTDWLHAIRDALTDRKESLSSETGQINFKRK